MDGNTLSKKDLSANDIKNITNLSFESYLQDSISAFKDLKSKDLEIEKSSESVDEEIRVIKAQYKQMSQESAEAAELKTSFSSKIKNFFIKVWSMICDIFYKFSEIVVNLIKSLIIFIQKKRIQATSVINLMKDKGLNGLTADGEDIYEMIRKNGFKIRTFNAGGDNLPKTDRAKFEDVHKRLNNIDLKTFIKSAIILKNKDSIFNIESLKKYFAQDLIGNENPDEQKLANLELAVNYLYAQAVFYGEVSPNHKKESDILSERKSLIESRDITKVAHSLTYGTTELHFDDIPLDEFFNIGAENKQSAFKTMWINYCQDTKLVLDKGGYIDTLEEILKRYKEIAKADAQNIKAINDYIKNTLNNLNGAEDDAKVESKVKRFTNLVLNVKNIKNHFIRLRQTVILDIITLYSMENRAWYLATGKAAMVKNTSDDESAQIEETSTALKDSIISSDNNEYKYSENDQ